jgi:ribosomal protein S18 acetylase RimI-like enzyme
MEIIPAQSDDHLLAARNLFVEYADYLGVDLRFQGFQQELDGLPGDYAPRDGRLLLAIENDQPVGCVAVRKLGNGICEMKRFYVQPGHRGKGLGRKLAEAIIAEARAIGYEKMRLDSLTSLKEAAGLYRSLGFTEISSYRYNPLPEGAVLNVSRAQRDFKRLGTVQRRLVTNGEFRHTSASKAVAGLRLLLLRLLGQLARLPLHVSPESFHLLRGLVLVRVDLVFVHRDRRTGPLVRAVGGKTEPTAVKPQAGDADQEQNDQNQ